MISIAFKFIFYNQINVFTFVDFRFSRFRFWTHNKRFAKLLVKLLPSCTPVAFILSMFSTPNLHCLTAVLPLAYVPLMLVHENHGQLGKWCVVSRIASFELGFVGGMTFLHELENSAGC